MLYKTGIKHLDYIYTNEYSVAVIEELVIVTRAGLPQFWLKH